MGLHDKLIINGTEFLLAVNQHGKGAPKTSTVGSVGALYMNESNGDLYKCLSVSGSTYRWEKIGSGNSLSMSGGTMTGPIDMGNHDFRNARDIDANSLTVRGTKRADDIYLENGTLSNTPAASTKDLVLRDGYGDNPVRVGGVADPKNPNDAVNLKYMQEHGTGGGGNFLPISGGTMTGNLNMGKHSIDGIDDATGKRFMVTDSRKNYITLEKDTSPADPDGKYRLSVLDDGDMLARIEAESPVRDSDVATKKYVDNHSGGGTGGGLPLTGGTMSGDIDMGKHAVTNASYTRSGEIRIGSDKYFPQDCLRLLYQPTNPKHLFLTISGDYNGEEVWVHNIADPTSESQAANKRYVDDAIQRALSSRAKEITYTDESGTVKTMKAIVME